MAAWLTNNLYGNSNDVTVDEAQKDLTELHKIVCAKEPHIAEEEDPTLEKFLKKKTKKGNVKPQYILSNNPPQATPMTLIKFS